MQAMTRFSEERWRALSPLARCYAWMLWHHWGYHGRSCFETRAKLAAKIGVRKDYVKRLELQLAGAGVWSLSVEGKLGVQPRTITFDESWIQWHQTGGLSSPGDEDTRVLSSPGGGTVVPRVVDARPQGGGTVVHPYQDREERELDRTREKGRGSAASSQKRRRDPITATQAREMALRTGGLEPELPPELDTPAFREAWADWYAYRREARLKRYTPRGAKAQLTRLSRMGSDAACEAIAHSIAQTYQGIHAGSQGRTGRPGQMPREVQKAGIIGFFNDLEELKRNGKVK